MSKIVSIAQNFWAFNALTKIPNIQDGGVMNKDITREKNTRVQTEAVMSAQLPYKQLSVPLGNQISTSIEKGKIAFQFLSFEE